MTEPQMMTYTGKKVNPLDLQPEDIYVADIAHHLALINRFVGSTKRPLSVAQHSVYVSRLCDGTGWEREALFHDAPEAYLGDVSKWVKMTNTMQGYRDAEERAWLAICTALNLRPELDEVVVTADTLMVRYEALRQHAGCRHLFKIPTHSKPTVEEIALVGPWKPWTWKLSETGFHDRLRLLEMLQIPSLGAAGVATGSAPVGE